MRFPVTCLLLSPLVYGCAPATSSSDPDAPGGMPGAATDGEEGPSSSTDSRPVLETASAQISGRTGGDLHVAFSGNDADGDATYLHVTFLNAGGSTIPAFDLDRDGVLDGEGLILPDDPISELTSFRGTLTLPGVAAQNPTLARVIVAVEDAAGQRSSELTSPVLPQGTAGAGAACDTTYYLTRCEEGLSCHGAPEVCQEPQAPVVTQVAYFRDDAGPRILIAGTDPDNDVAYMLLEFLDASGNPTEVSLDGEGGALEASFELLTPDASANGVFFHLNQAAEGFDLVVPKIAVTVFDEGDRASERKVANLSNVPVKSSGQSCDLRGFDACREGLTCQWNTAGTATTCTSVTTAANAACNEAPELRPLEGAASVVVEAEGGGIWNPPEGCAAQDPQGRPDAVVLLRLSTAVLNLVISTKGPGTNFDTIVYLLPTCAADSGPALGCNDDSPPGAASELRLENVPAGDYAIVVDSWDPTGGFAEVTVTVE